MSDNYEFVIKPDGKLLRRNIVEQELNIEDSLMKELASDLMVKTKGVAFLEGWGNVHFAAKPGNITWWTVDLDKIPLKTYYKTVDGVVVPVFASTGGDPVFPLVWKVQSGITLKMCVGTTVYDNSGDDHIMMDKSFLFAYDDSKRCWRVPLANLYETCQLCLGNERIYGRNSLDCLKNVLTTFANAQWNADLANLSPSTLVEKFFRFKITDEGFETLPIEGNWTDLCTKVARPEMEYVC